MNGLPAGDAGTIEHKTFGQRFFINRANVLGCVVPFAAHVGEAQVNVLHIVLLDLIENVFDG